MPIDPRIALGYQPPQTESPVNLMLQMQQMQAGRQANALQQAQMAEYQRKLQDQNALRATLAGFTPDMGAEQQVSALQRGGHLAEARLLAESLAKTAADKRAEEKSALEAEHKRLEMRGQVYGSVAANPTLENAQSALQYLLDNKLVDPNNATKVWQQIQDNPSPDNIRGLAQRFQTMSLSSKDQLEQHFQEQNLGASVRTLAMPKFGLGAATVVPGSTGQVTPSPNAPKTTINVAAPGKKFAETVGEKAAEQLNTQLTQAQSAQSSLATSAQLAPLLNSPDFISGTLGDVRLTVAKALGLAGAEETQAYFAGIGQQVAERIKAFGAGTGLSDSDRKFAEKIAGGSSDLTPEAIKRIVRINDDSARRVIGAYNERRQFLAKANPEVTNYYPSLEASGGAPIPRGQAGGEAGGAAGSDLAAAAAAELARRRAGKK